MGHHRSLRPGHVYIGVIWELGRTRCFLERPPESRDKPVEQYILALSRRFPLDNETAKAEDHEQAKAPRYQVTSEERRNLRRAFGSLSGA